MPSPIRTTHRLQTDHTMKTTQHLLFTSLILCLTACDSLVNKMADSIDETEVRTNFVDSCASAMSDQSQSKISLTQGKTICGCMYDQVAQGYSDKEEWKRTIIRMGLPSSDENERNAFMQRFDTAAPNCIRQSLSN